MTISRAYALQHFDEICERAENSEEIVLERPGKPGVALVPRPAEPVKVQLQDAVDSMLAFMRSRPRSAGRIDLSCLLRAL